MALTPAQSLIIIIGIACATLLTRALPFILFPSGKKMPKYVTYLGNVLPFAIIGVLVVYSLKDIRITRYPYALPEIISVILTAILHIWKRNNLLSIAGGTLVYMLLLRLV
jgi:branched-subunit amino acid transport protein AzlD